MRVREANMRDYIDHHKYNPADDTDDFCRCGEGEKHPCYSSHLFMAGGCPECGDDILGHANDDGTFNDGDRLICAGCYVKLSVCIDEDGATYSEDYAPPNTEMSGTTAPRESTTKEVGPCAVAEEH